MPSSDLITRKLSIAGHVQGVGFRFYMQRKARELGVTGWVRNRRMTAWARRGPPSAMVAELRIADATGDYPTFETLPTE